MTDDVKQEDSGKVDGGVISAGAKKDTWAASPWIGELDYLYRRSQDGKEFHKLMRDVKDRRNILMARDELEKSPGSWIAGRDGQTIADLKAMTDDELAAYVERRLEYYNPKAVLAMTDGDRLLPFGIPAISDRLIQQCFRQVLEPIAEAQFVERSNGYRPMRKAEHALAQCYAFIQKRHMYFALSFRLQDVLGEIPCGKVLRRLWSMGVRERTFLSIIGTMLQSGTANIAFPKKNSPGGGIISPLLANIVLDELDHWVYSQWEDFPTRQNKEYVRSDNGVVDKNQKYEMLRKHSNLKEVYIVRYADSVVIFCANRDAAERMAHAVQDWLLHRLRINLPLETFKVYKLRKRSMPFMGFRIRAKQKGTDKKGQPAFVVESHVSDHALQGIKNRLKASLAKIQHSGSIYAMARNVERHNELIMKIHAYFCYATHVSADMRRLQLGMLCAMHNRLEDSLKAQGNLYQVPTAYRQSSQLRYIQGHPILPIGYVQSKAPRYKKREFVPYTPEGRAAWKKAAQPKKSAKPRKRGGRKSADK